MPLMGNTRSREGDGEQPDAKRARIAEAEVRSLRAQNAAQLLKIAAQAAEIAALAPQAATLQALTPLPVLDVSAQSIFTGRATLTWDRQSGGGTPTHFVIGAIDATTGARHEDIAREEGGGAIGCVVVNAAQLTVGRKMHFFVTAIVETAHGATLRCSAPSEPSKSITIDAKDFSTVAHRRLLVGPSVHALCDADSFSEEPPAITETRLGDPASGWVIPDEITCVVLHNVFSQSECAAIVAAVPSSGDGFMSEVDVARAYRGRVCSRFKSDDPALSDLVQERVQEYLPHTVDGGTFLRINPGWRHVHYRGAADGGGHQEYHIDGREPFLPAQLEASPLDAAEGTPAAEVERFLQSRLTLMVYLNDGGGVNFDGGATTFLTKDEEGNLQPRVGGRYDPVAGDCLLFYQESIELLEDSGATLLLHQGSVVTRGEKRMMRTVVDYVFEDPTLDYGGALRCAWNETLSASG